MPKWDKDSFDSIFKTYYPRMFSFACSYVEEEFAEDIVQEVFVNVWKKGMEHFKPQTIKSYLYTAVKNTCIVFLKKQKSVVHMDNVNFEDDLFFEKSVLEEEIYICLDGLIKKFPERYRLVFEKLLMGKSDEEIREDMNLSVDAYKSIKKRGKLMLKSNLDPSMYFVFLCHIERHHIPPVLICGKSMDYIL